MQQKLGVIKKGSIGLDKAECSEMSNQGIKNNGVNGIKERMKWEKEVNKIVIECWIRSEPAKRKYRQRMKKIWDEIRVLL